MFAAFLTLIALAFVTLSYACVRRIERVAVQESGFDVYDGPGVQDAEYAAFLRSIDRIAAKSGRSCPWCGLAVPET
jgi:hypothetical protein